MSETITVLRQLAAAFPNSTMTKETIAVYLRLLSDIPADVLQTIVDQCLVECKFLPTIAELRERYRLLTVDVNAPTAEQGWEEVMREMRRVGTWSAPEFDDPVIAPVVKSLGGWVVICSSLEKDLPFLRKAFLDQYAGMTKRQKQIEAMTPDSLRFIADRHEGTTAGDIAQNLLARLSGEIPKALPDRNGDAPLRLIPLDGDHD